MLDKETAFFYWYIWSLFSKNEPNFCRLCWTLWQEMWKKEDLSLNRDQWPTWKSNLDSSLLLSLYCLRKRTKGQLLATIPLLYYVRLFVRLLFISSPPQLGGATVTSESWYWTNGPPPFAAFRLLSSKLLDKAFMGINVTNKMFSKIILNQQI